MTPLNGTKTHELSEHALEELRNLARAPMPTMQINPGVVNRLQREELAEVVQLPSPFKAHKGGTCNHLQITDKGRERLSTPE
jgi:hypothetical protein